VELLDPPRTGPVTGEVVRRRDGGPARALSAFHADVFPAEKAEAEGGAAGGTGGGPTNAPPLEEMGVGQVPNWEAEKQQRRANARNCNDEGELDGAFVIWAKPPTPLQHEGDRVPWRPTHPLPQKGLQYVRNCLTAVTKSRREGRPSDHEDHAQGANILPKRTNRRHASRSDLHKAQRHGFPCHLGREWVDTYANLPDGVTVTGRQRFSEGERTYRLEAMQYLVADLEAHYARLPNQPNLREIWAFHQRLVPPASQRGRSKITQEFTVVYPDPDLKVNAPGTRGAPRNEDLGPWQSHMAWEYGTYWVAGFLAHRRRYVAGPPPANVGLWPIAPLTHPKSEESEEEGDKGQGAVEGPQGGEGPQGVTAPSGPVMAPPSIAPPVVAPTVPTTGRTGVPAFQPVIPTPTVAPTPVATPTVPLTRAPERPVITTTTTGAQLPRERPPSTDERQAKRAATDTAVSLRGPQLTAGGGTSAGPAAGAVAPEEAQADQRWEAAKAEVQRLWTLAQDLQTEARTKASFTTFRDQANLAQDALQQAKEVLRQAREDRVAAVGALPIVGLQVPGAPSVLVPSEQLESDCRDQVQALAEKILKRGAAARTAATRAVIRAAQERGEARGSHAVTQPGTMPPPPTPMRTMVATATPAGQQPTGGAGGPGLGPATATRPGPATVTRS
jgi:hypothetical protein